MRFNIGGNFFFELFSSSNFAFSRSRGKMRLAWCKHKRRLRQSFGKFFFLVFLFSRKIAVSFFSSVLCVQKNVCCENVNKRGKFSLSSLDASERENEKHMEKLLSIAGSVGKLYKNIFHSLSERGTLGKFTTLATCNWNFEVGLSHTLIDSFNSINMRKPNGPSSN